jgi:hypothetical protein
MNIQAINQELAKIGYKAVPIKAKKAKEARIPWPLGPKKLGAPKFKSRTYGITVGQSTAARISLTEFAEIKKRSGDMFTDGVSLAMSET